MVLWLDSFHVMYKEELRLVPWLDKILTQDMGDI